MHVRFFPPVCLALLHLACARPAEGPLPGASDAWRQKQPRTAAKPEPEAPVWSSQAEVRSWPPLNEQPFLSRGHLPAVEVDVVASAASRDAYLALVTDSVLPQGTLIAERAHDLAAANAHQLVMQKRADGWSYLDLDARGRVLAEGRLARCEGCHALAPADHAFGLPRRP
jgi:hypothetical protein